MSEPKQPEIFINGEKVSVAYVWPPIPVRQFDWCATLESYDPEAKGQRIGWGKTADEAIQDLRNEIEADQ